MTLNLTGSGSGRFAIKDDLKALSTKQRVAVIAAIAIALILEVLGLAASCLGFLIIAVLLYMIPHLMKVTSVKVKAFIGVVFIVVSLLVGVFAYVTVPDDYARTIDEDSDTIRNMEVTEVDGVYTLTFDVNPTVAGVGDTWDVRVYNGDISMISFGSIGGLRSTNDTYLTDSGNASIADKDKDNTYLRGGLVAYTTASDSGWYRGSVVLDMSDHEFEYLLISIEDVTIEENGNVYDVSRDSKSSVGFTYDSGVSFGDTLVMCLYGSGFITLMIAILFFIILAFSAMFRGKAEKERTKMEAEGRLYPKGYGLCKNCGTVVLPGEVTCRKCGAYIDVPEDMKPKKKDFFTCSVCGAEVPSDATECPKCGAKFDEETEVEVEHPDGTVDVTEETMPCPHCGESIPSNADWCPKCGKKVRE